MAERTDSQSRGLRGKDERDAFYVGYLPAPAGVKRAATAAGVSAVALLAVLGATAPMALREPGPAVWELSEQVEATGVLRLAPYPHLVLTDTDGQETERLLLGEEFKTGVQSRLADLAGGDPMSLDGRAVTASGWMLDREGRRMLTLAPGDGGLTLVDGASADASPREVADGAVTLSGEILDGKCYLGAMKPGDGAAHRACAMLCLRGGLPALFVERGGPNDGRVHWIADAEGGGIDEALIPLVARPVVLRGRLERLGTASVLRVEWSGVR